MIFAVDPGPLESAFVTWDGMCVIAHGKINNDALLQRDEPSRMPCVIEMINAQGMEIGQTTIDTILWVGRFYQAWDSVRNPVTLITRREVKLHMCGTSRAKDKNIRQAVIDRIGPPGRKKAPGVTYGIVDDQWQALALALVWYDLGAVAFFGQA